MERAKVIKLNVVPGMLILAIILTPLNIPSLLGAVDSYDGIVNGLMV